MGADHVPDAEQVVNQAAEPAAAREVPLVETQALGQQAEAGVPLVSAAEAVLAEQKLVKMSTESMQGHSWNVFRYTGDGLHLLGVTALVCTLLRNRSCHGFSRSTQILYFLVFLTRYLDLLFFSQTTYLVAFKLTYLATSMLVLFLFVRWRHTYEWQKDTCNLIILILPCLLATVLLTEKSSAVEVLWGFSQFLEGFALVPQYIFCYRDRLCKDRGVALYVICLGGYRSFYVMNWIYKKVMMPRYWDLNSWVGGLIEICFFVDYVLSLAYEKSVLRSFVLNVDQKINEFQERVEQKVLGENQSGLRYRGRVEEKAPVSMDEV